MYTRWAYLGYRWMVHIGMEGPIRYRWPVLGMDVPRVQVADTRDERTSGTGGWYWRWTYLGYRWMVVRMVGPRVQVADIRSGHTG